MKVYFDKSLYDLESEGHRYLLHNDVDKILSDAYSDLVDIEYDKRLVAEKIHTAISVKDVETIKCMHNDAIDFEYEFKIVEKDLKEILLENGYEVYESDLTFSLYVINDNGKEVRISDHKMSSYNTDCLYCKKYEIIDKYGVINRSDLEKNDIYISGNDYIFYL
ncbi:TPA: hypothetical protein PEE30_002841 [Staphylococcus aureus]|nr:hypothetical protein [Staphylococcus aureus]